MKFFLRFFQILFWVYEQHAGNQDCRTADSPQKVITHVQVITSQQSGRPQSTVKVTKNEVPDNHSERVWGIAQVLAVELVVKFLLALLSPIYFLTLQ